MKEEADAEVMKAREEAVASTREELGTEMARMLEAERAAAAIAAGKVAEKAAYEGQKRVEAAAARKSGGCREAGSGAGGEAYRGREEGGGGCSGGEGEGGGRDYECGRRRRRRRWPGRQLRRRACRKLRMTWKRRRGRWSKPSFLRRTSSAAQKAGRRRGGWRRAEAAAKTALQEFEQNEGLCSPGCTGGLPSQRLEEERRQAAEQLAEVQDVEASSESGGSGGGGKCRPRLEVVEAAAAAKASGAEAAEARARELAAKLAEVEADNRGSIVRVALETAEAEVEKARKDAETAEQSAKYFE